MVEIPNNQPEIYKTLQIMVDSPISIGAGFLLSTVGKDHLFFKASGLLVLGVPGKVAGDESDSLKVGTLPNIERIDTPKFIAMI